MKWMDRDDKLNAPLLEKESSKFCRLMEREIMSLFMEQVFNEMSFCFIF